MEGHDEKFRNAARRFRESLTEINSKRRTVRILGPEFEEQLGKGKRIKVVPTTPDAVSQHHVTTTSQQQPIVQQHTTDTTNSSSNNIIAPHNNNTTNMSEKGNTSFKYPVNSRGYTVTTKDEECLEEGKWLNDSIVNVTLSWIYHEILGPTWLTTIRIVDSLWYDSAIRDYSTGGTDALVKNMERMKKWFPAGHPFDGRMTIIPVCQSHHWFAIIAIEVGEGWLVTVLDSLDTKTSQTALSRVTEIIKLCWPQNFVDTISCKVPRQNNLTDCGLHLIRNVGRIMVWITINQGSTWEVLEEFLQQTPQPVSREVLKALMNCLRGGKSGDELNVEIIGYVEQREAENTEVDKEAENMEVDKEAENMEVDKEEADMKVEAVGMKMNEEAEDTKVDEEMETEVEVHTEDYKDPLSDDLYLSESENENENEEGHVVIQGHSHLVREEITWSNKSNTPWKISAMQEHLMQTTINTAKKDLKGKRQIKIKRRLGNTTVQIRLYHRHATIIKT